ncbi:MAG: aldo/keto reductase [Planctomycetes bacterium]|nr:aldo/keto reductase [Planctomycetota bacterium]
MSTFRPSRREVLRASAAAAAAVTILPRASALGRQDGAAVPVALERRRFGKTDLTVALLGFGGAEIGYERAEPAVVERLLNTALDAGLNVVDTAECYLDSEEKIGAAIGHRRKDFHLFTKCGHATDASGAGQEWTKSGVLLSLERSLKRLKTDAVDLLQLHSCSLEELRKGECIEGLEQAKRDGKARYLGYSGDSKAARFAVECGRFDALQTSVNICDQECIELTLPLAREKGLGVIAKRPIANAVWRYDAEPGNGYHVPYWKRLQELAYPFAQGEARSSQGPEGAAGVALRFSAMQPGVHVLIVGTTKPERWQQNAALLAAGPLQKELHDAIRATWKRTAKDDWTGLT